MSEPATETPTRATLIRRLAVGEDLWFAWESDNQYAAIRGSAYTVAKQEIAPRRFMAQKIGKTQIRIKRMV